MLRVNEPPAKQSAAEDEISKNATELLDSVIKITVETHITLVRVRESLEKLKEMLFLEGAIDRSFTDGTKYDAFH